MEDPVNEAEITPAVNILDISTYPLGIEEVKMAIAKLNHGKAAGIDQTSAELLKTEEVWIPIILKNILQKIWESEEAPTFWKTGLMVKLPKRGSLKLQQLQRHNAALSQRKS